MNLNLNSKITIDLVSNISTINPIKLFNFIFIINSTKLFIYLTSFIDPPLLY